MSRYDLKFGASWLSDLGARSTRPPEIEIAQRKGEFKEIPGKDGAEYIDYGSYDNVEFERDISFVGTPSATVQQKVDALIDSFAYLQGYQPFEDTDHPDMVTEAVLMNFGDVNKQLRTLRSTILRFNRKPFWYLKTALVETSYSIAQLMNGITLTNPYPVFSKPMIRIKKSTNTQQVTYQKIECDVIINGVTLTLDFAFKDKNGNYADGSVVIDVESQSVYELIDGGEIVPLDIDIPKGFKLSTDNNAISITRRLNTIHSVHITPKWRRL